MTATDTEVIITGAGPVGLTMAGILARRGVGVVVLEQRGEIDEEPKASTFHAPTLELLDWLEVTDGLLARGLIADRYQHRDRSEGVVAEFDLGVLADDTRYPFRLQCEQQRLSELLLERLRDEPNVEVRYAARVDGFQETADTVAVIVDTGSGHERISGRYLLGTDGASSTIRTQLDIAFEGTTYEDRYLVFLTDVPFEDHLADLCLVNYISDPEEFVVLLRAPEAWRVLFRAPAELTDDAAHDPALAQRKLHGVLPRDADYPILHTQLYRIHQRVADTFRVGRTMLLGDAAHINSPIGGMGMNNGIHDAFDLGRTLPGVLRGSLSDAELDGWSQRRRSVAQEYVRVITDRNARSLGEQDDASRRAHQRELAALASDPVRARRWLLSSSMIEPVRAQHLLPYA